MGEVAFDLLTFWVKSKSVCKRKRGASFFRILDIATTSHERERKRHMSDSNTPPLWLQVPEPHDLVRKFGTALDVPAFGDRTLRPALRGLPDQLHEQQL